MAATVTSLCTRILGQQHERHFGFLAEELQSISPRSNNSPIFGARYQQNATLMTNRFDDDFKKRAMILMTRFAATLQSAIAKTFLSAPPR